MSEVNGMLLLTIIIIVAITFFLIPVIVFLYLAIMYIVDIIKDKVRKIVH